MNEERLSLAQTRERLGMWHHLDMLDGQQGWPPESGSRLPQSMSLPPV